MLQHYQDTMNKNSVWWMNNDTEKDIFISKDIGRRFWFWKDITVIETHYFKYKNLQNTWSCLFVKCLIDNFFFVEFSDISVETRIVLSKADFSKNSFANVLYNRIPKVIQMFTLSSLSTFFYKSNHPIASTNEFLVCRRFFHGQLHFFQRLLFTKL